MMEDDDGPGWWCRKCVEANSVFEEEDDEQLQQKELTDEEEVGEDEKEEEEVEKEEEDVAKEAAPSEEKQDDDDDEEEASDDDDDKEEEEEQVRERGPRGPGTATTQKKAKKPFEQKVWTELTEEEKEEYEELFWEDTKQRCYGCMGVIAMWLFWGIPTVLWFMEKPHYLSYRARHELHKHLPKGELTFLRPQDESAVPWTETVVEWMLSPDFVNVSASSQVQINLWLDKTRVLGGPDGILNLPAPTYKPNSSDLEPFRLSYDLGALDFGIHRLNISISSRHRPRKFKKLKNESFFIAMPPAGHDIPDDYTLIH